MNSMNSSGSPDPRPDAELPLEEVPDCDRCGEGDLAHLHLEGECTAGEEQAGGSRDGVALVLWRWRQLG